MIEPAHKQVLSLKAYVGGKSAVAGVSKVVKLSSNEGAFGVNPVVAKACADKIKDLFRYPDGASAALREAIASAHGISPERIVCGTGSDELIGLLCHAYLRENDEVIVTQYAFLMYRLYSMTCGANVVQVPEKDFKIDIDAILNAVTPKTKIVFIANPGNPTGTYLNKDEVRRLCENLPKDVLLVLDNAYAEFVTAPDYDAGIGAVNGFENVVMLRTFSKIYGLGGVRLGWAYASAEIADILNRIRGPFNVNMMAQCAGVAAVKDAAFVEKCRAHNQKWLNRLPDFFKNLGLDCVPSVANFILVKFPNADKTAAGANEFLLSKGIIVRAMNSYGLPDCLRVTIGSDEDMEAFTQALTAYMKA